VTTLPRWLPLVLAPLLLFGCSSDETPGTPVSAAPETTSAAPADGTVADEYCAAVDEFLAAAKKAAADPLKADTDQVKAQVQELRNRASELAGELFNNPEGIAQVQQCTQKLQEFSQEG
jgi:hypothetical protein